MPTVGNLDSLRERTSGSLAVASAAVTRDDADLGPLAQPGLDGAIVTVRQKRDHLPVLQIASLLAYATFLVHLTGGAFVGALVMTGALVLVVREFAASVAPLGTGVPFLAPRRRGALGA